MPFILVAISLCGLAAQPAHAEHITIFAAASTTEALSQAVNIYEHENGVEVEVAFGASASLASSIRDGSPVDLFLSADESSMDDLAAQGLIVPSTRTDYLRNKLVLIAPIDSNVSVSIAPGFPLDAALAGGHLAMGDRNEPAGVYGQAALEALGVWGKVKPEVALQPNVRAVLGAVLRREATAGIVYATDARQAKVRVAGSFPDGTYPPIIYPLALVSGRDSVAGARAFYDFLLTARVRDIFASRGFARP